MTIFGPSMTLFQLVMTIFGLSMTMFQLLMAAHS